MVNYTLHHLIRNAFRVSDNELTCEQETRKEESGRGEIVLCNNYGTGSVTTTPTVPVFV